MSYQALYRQWRPNHFDDVIGQDHIILPLKHQIITQTYGHAYLFSGTRGTGKTSTAKILARAVNCLNIQDGNPCNACDNCLSIMDDQFIDVVEMDAASNNSVDDIRELREHVKFSPSKGKFKVYIIDEVHMLSQGAFNALLKTLEEPPEYVMFILATTEIQKIPATILSRCQRYEFKRVSYEALQTRLEHICDNLDIQYESDAIKLIIEKSDGAVRDSLSTLDQCLSSGQKGLTIESVVDTLGIVEKTHLALMVQLMSQYHVPEVLKQVGTIVDLGKDLSQFLNGLIETYRDLLIAKMVKDNHELLIKASNEYIDTLRIIAEDVSQTHIARALEQLIDLSKTIKYSQNKRIMLESTLISIMSPDIHSNLNALIERIERLEKKQPILSVAEDHMDKSPEATKIEESNGIQEFIEFTEEAIDCDIISNVWGQFLAFIHEKKVSLSPFLEGSRPIALKGTKCLVALKPENKMFVNLLMGASNAEYINHNISRLVKKNISLEYVINDVEEPTHDDTTAQIMDFFKDYKDVLNIKK